MSDRVRKLDTRMVPKVWGMKTLPQPFVAPDGERIGEIWFEPPSELPDLLVKYLFTSEKLSVQVHPSQSQARQGEAGKEECWFVLDAKPGARLAIGFAEEISPQDMGDAARDGSIEDLLVWHETRAGDIFYLPAGTVHAIGPGVTLVEVQQASETTFRLYDYGRPRELHLKRALAVAEGTPYAAKHRGSMAQRGQHLVDGPFFRMDRVEGEPDETTRHDFDAPLLALPLKGRIGSLDGDTVAGPGECVYAPTLDSIDFGKAEITLLTRSAAR